VESERSYPGKLTMPRKSYFKIQEYKVKHRQLVEKPMLMTERLNNAKMALELPYWRMGTSSKEIITTEQWNECVKNRVHSRGPGLVNLRFLTRQFSKEIKAEWNLSKVKTTFDLFSSNLFYYFTTHRWRTILPKTEQTNTHLPAIFVTNAMHHEHLS